VVPQAVERTAGRYVAQLDQLLPDVVTGFYLVGSVALDAYRLARSDVDFVAVLARTSVRRSCAAFACSTLAAALTPEWPLFVTVARR
jgi:hypothetical protein